MPNRLTEQEKEARESVVYSIRLFPDSSGKIPINGRNYDVEITMEPLFESITDELPDKNHKRIFRESMIRDTWAAIGYAQKTYDGSQKTPNEVTAHRFADGRLTILATD